MQEIKREVLVSKASELLANGTVDRVLGWKNGEFDYDVTPGIFRSAEDLEKDFVWGDFCGANFSKYLVKETGKGDGKVLVFLKPCDTYSFNQLLTEHRFDREKVYAVGVPCEGMLDVEQIKRSVDSVASVREDGDKVLVETLFDGTVELDRNDLLPDRCKNCKSKKQNNMDIKIEKKPWYIRYKFYIAGGIAFVAFLVYVIILSAGPRKLRIESENIQIAEVKDDKFMEYVDVEGLIQPILTIKVNTREAGSVERIIAEEGSLLQKGDTILTLSNPDLLRSIEDQRDDWEKQRITYQEKEIEMEQKSLSLKQQTLETNYELARLKKSFTLDKEEFRMGIKSKAQLEVSEDEYNYKVKNAELQREGLRHDSAVTIIRKDLIRTDMERERKKYERATERLGNLVVKAPISGQLSFVKVTPGQQVGSSESIAEIKVLDQYKIHTSLSEYYIDRITTGLPATVNYQGKKYPLRITKVVPEVKDRMFDVDLVFTGEMPDNVRVGKSFRVQIELGQPEQAIVIPRGNFYQATGGQWIYKANASKTKAVRTPITIGRQNPQQYEITGGLEPGDYVVTTGYDTFGDAEELILK